MTDQPHREARLKELEKFKNLAEKAYDDMYEAHEQRGINTCYRDAKDYYYEAIGLANELGLQEEADAMSKRLTHIKAVYRSQFAG
jgi:hypothetical protein